MVRMGMRVDYQADVFNLETILFHSFGQRIKTGLTKLVSNMPGINEHMRPPATQYASKETTIAVVPSPLPDVAMQAVYQLHRIVIPRRSRNHSFEPQTDYRVKFAENQLMLNLRRLAKWEISEVPGRSPMRKPIS
jgi:hypothetical protein